MIFWMIILSRTMIGTVWDGKVTVSGASKTGTGGGGDGSDDVTIGTS